MKEWHISQYFARLFVFRKMATLCPISLNTSEWISGPKPQSDLFLFLFLIFGAEELDLEMDPWLHLCLERELRQF
jgi:hypothetical protein